MRLETEHLILCELDELNWVIMIKGSEISAGRIAIDKTKDIVRVTSFSLDAEARNQEVAEEVLEAFCNVVFYHLNARKLLVSCQNGDVLPDEVYLLFGFRCELDEKQTGECGKQYSLYKEEYVAWLRKHSKALSSERLNSMRTVFLVVAMAGVCLFGLDMIRKVNTLMTSLYVYVTGIGVAGAIVSSYLSAKHGHRQKDGEDANAG